MVAVSQRKPRRPQGILPCSAREFGSAAVFISTSVRAAGLVWDAVAFEAMAALGAGYLAKSLLINEWHMRTATVLTRVRRTRISIVAWILACRRAAVCAEPALSIAIADEFPPALVDGANCPGRLLLAHANATPTKLANALEALTVVHSAFFVKNDRVAARTYTLIGACQAQSPLSRSAATPVFCARIAVIATGFIRLMPAAHAANANAGCAAVLARGAIGFGPNGNAVTALTYARLGAWLIIITILPLLYLTRRGASPLAVANAIDAAGILSCLIGGFVCLTTRRASRLWHSYAIPGRLTLVLHAVFVGVNRPKIIRVAERIRSDGTTTMTRARTDAILHTFA
jgi:hypothetical protein